MSRILTVITKMKNKYDYQEFLAVAQENRLDPMSFTNYGRFVEALDVAKQKFPEETLADAMIALFFPVLPTVVMPIPQNPNSDCGNCGGGKVL